MAEVISKTSLFFGGGACVNHHHHHVDDLSVSPVSFGFKKSFSSSLKQKPLRSDFSGKQILETFNRSFRSSSVTAQVDPKIHSDMFELLVGSVGKDLFKHV